MIRILRNKMDMEMIKDTYENAKTFANAKSIVIKTPIGNEYVCYKQTKPQN